MTDFEIGIAKAMLQKGMRNDAIHFHFHFNRSDRLISSGRIAQIRNGKYGASVAAADPDELESFLSDWKARQVGARSQGTASPVDPNLLSDMFSEKLGSWILRGGETDQSECKLSFRLSPEERFASVVKSIAGLANNGGGYILFGIRNATFCVEGLPDNSFHDTDPASINRILAGALDPVPHVTKASVSIGGNRIGVLYVAKHENAPVVSGRPGGNDLFPLRGRNACHQARRASADYC
jgi:hypothetical protein